MKLLLLNLKLTNPSKQAICEHISRRLFTKNVTNWQLGF